MGESTTLAVHRCRFVDYTPSAITSIAFPPLPLPSLFKNSKGKSKASPNSTANTAHAQIPKVGTLAVGRANGNIELYEWTGSQREVQAPQAWVVRQVRTIELADFRPKISDERILYYGHDLDVNRSSGIQNRLFSLHTSLPRLGIPR